MGIRKGRAKGVVTPTRMMVDVSCRQLRKKKAAKSARFSSTSDVSLVNRLMILPVGVTWKKERGALHHRRRRSLSGSIERHEDVVVASPVQGEGESGSL